MAVVVAQKLQQFLCFLYSFQYLFLNRKAKTYFTVGTINQLFNAFEQLHH